jgi:hypothetical protein
MGGACSTNGAKRNTYRLLVGRQEDQDVDRWILGWILQRWAGVVWCGMLRSYRVASQLVAPTVVLSSLELVS